MDLADEWLNVPKILTPEEIVNPKLDEQSMMTYLSQFPNAKLKPGAPLRQRTNPSKVRAYGPGIRQFICSATESSHQQNKKRGSKFGLWRRCPASYTKLPLGIPDVF